MHARWFTSVLCGALALWGPAASAQVVWERTLSGEWVINHLATGIQSASNLIGTKMAFNMKIEAARARYFATLKDLAAHAEAEEEFARLLLEKDLYYIALALMNPVRGGNEGPGLFQAIDHLAGGPLDGSMGGTGMPFKALVRSLRSKLGATDDRMPIAVGVLVPGQYQKALAESLPQFQAHIADRMRHEYSRYAMQNAAAVDPANPMFDREILTRTRVIAMAESHASSRHVVDRVPANVKAGIQRAEQAGQQIIECKYGRDTSDGGSGSSSYEFWYRSPPGDFANWGRDVEQRHTYLYSLGDQAVPACPAIRPLAHKALWASMAMRRTTHAEQQQRDLQAEQERTASQQQAQRERNEAQVKASREAMAARQQAQRDAQQQRQCAATDAQIERLRAQMQAAPPVLAARREPQLKELERARAERCG